MNAIAVPRFLGSTVGKKMVMAVTGTILFLFVIGHMIGNLQLYKGAESLNSYAELLHSKPPLLWAVRLVMLATVLAHIVTAIQLTRGKRAARPVPYDMRTFRKASYASRMMMVGGVALLLFIIYHLLHFTTGTTHPDFQSSSVYANVVAGFTNVPASLAYILAMVALGFHLHHGGTSLFQTMGASHPRYNGVIETVTLVATFAVVVANISFPLAVLLGLVQ